MEAHKIETFIIVDPDIEVYLTEITEMLANNYHIYTDMKEIVAHAIVEMYLELKKEAIFFTD